MIGYEQSHQALYEEMFARYLERRKEAPPAG